MGRGREGARYFGGIKRPGSKPVSGRTVKCYYWAGWGNDGNITKIEFLNGASRDAPVLETKTVNIALDELSTVYRV